MRPIVGVVNVRREPEYGSWSSAPGPAKAESIRDRIGRHVSTTLDGAAGLGIRVTDSFRLLTPEQLLLVYARTPDVRAAIDGIARRISTWAWTMEIEGLSPDDPSYEAALDAAAEAKRFLSAPNANGETWQELLTKLVVDLLVYEHGVIEQVYDRLVDAPLPRPDKGEGGPPTTAMVKIPATKAKLVELVALHGASVSPISDSFGRVWGYQQDVYATLGPMSAARADPLAVPVFSREQIVSVSLFANTSGRTLPLIETIVNEVIAIMRSSEHSMLALDADEIPPGILVLTGVAGKAAESAKLDLQRLRGKDHKIRVITNPDPRGSGANWVELRRTPKDLSMIEVVREIRRTIWRIFGVLPVEMGDTQDMPRAVGQVQLDVSSSHLVEPILDLLEAKVNARIVPLLVGKFAGMIAFRFDREAKLSPAEQREKADALVSLVREGVLTRNEARQEIDQEPIPGGDVATIATTGGLQRVADLLLAPIPGPGGDPGSAPPASDGADEPTDEPTDEEPAEEPAEEEPEPGDEAPGEVDGGEAGDEAPGEIEAARPLRKAPKYRVLSLASEWPSAELFKGRRTVDIRALGDAIDAYSRRVRPLYRECRDEVVAAVAADYDGGIGSDGAQRVSAAVEAAFSKLLVRWRAITEPLYVETARSARDRASDFTGSDVVRDWRERGEAYGVRALGYLTASGGLLSDVRATVLGIIAAATGPAARAVKPAAGVSPGMAETELLSAVTAAFDSSEYRVDNWSGKLTELASETLASGLGEQPEVEYWYEWVSVGDGDMCAICTREGTAGFRPVSQLLIHPGSSTFCRANCRCVLVYWTRDEVTSGSATRLSGGAPGNAPL